MKRIVLGIMTIIYVILVIIAATSSIPERISKINDKALHFAEFFILGILVFATLGLYQFRDSMSIGILVVLALATELLQAITPNRKPSFYDFLADIVGIAVSFIIYKWISSKQSS